MKKAQLISSNLNSKLFRFHSFRPNLRPNDFLQLWRMANFADLLNERGSQKVSHPTPMTLIMNNADVTRVNLEMKVFMRYYKTAIK